MLRYLVLLRRAAWKAFEHDLLTLAKGAAYSAILTLFPAFLVLASLLGATRETSAFIKQFGAAVDRIFPPGTASAAMTYFQTPKHHPFHVVWSASTISLFAATGVMVTWMEGFRRAYGIQNNPWGFWHERMIAFLLVPLSLMPMAFATILVAFGNLIQTWVMLHLQHDIRPVVHLLWTLTRWIISALTSIGVVVLIYHMAVPQMQSWRRVLPGALLATLLWFPATIVFGWYLTRYANYSVIYGPLGAAIALLVWLYMLSIIILIGAEFNAQVFPKEALSRGRKA